MSWNLFTEAGAPLTLQVGVPRAYSGPRLPGAGVLCGQGEGSLIVLQELRLPLSVLRLHFFSFVQRTTLLGTVLNPSLQARTQISGRFSARLSGGGKCALKESQYALLGLPPAQCRSTFEK